MDGPDQLGLFDFEPPPKPPARRPKSPQGEEKGNCRLFFAFFPARDVVPLIKALGAEVIQREGLHGKLHADARLHMTLDHLGDFRDLPQAVVASAIEAAAGISHAPVRIRLDRVLTFKPKGPRGIESYPLVLKQSEPASRELAEFRAALWNALARHQVPGPSGPLFTPHVTLMYCATTVPEHQVAAVEWNAVDFVLIRSFIGDTRYEELGRWPLQPA